MEFNTSVLLSVVVVLCGVAFAVAAFSYAVISKRQLLRKWWFWLGTVAILFASIGLGVLNFINAYNVLPNIAYSYPNHEGVWNDYTKEFELNFNVPVVISRLNPQFSREDILGEWHYEKYLGVLPLTKKATFKPSQSLPEGQRGVMYIIGMARPGVSESHEQAVNFFSHNLPQVYASTPQNDSREIGLNTAIEIELENRNINLADWSFTTQPSFDFETKQLNNKFYLTPKSVLQQGVNYQIFVNRTAGILNFANNAFTPYDNPVQVAVIEFTTVKSPLLDDFTGWNGKVKLDANLQITFAQEMVPFDALNQVVISPAVDFSYTWKNNRTLIINPNSELTKDTSYNLQINHENIKTVMGGVLEAKIELSFATVGPVKVTTTEPLNSSLKVSRTTLIKVTFDQAVNTQSAESLFSISPAVSGRFTWEGNTLIYTLNGPLNFNSTYTVTLAPGIKSIDGFNSESPYSFSFTTVSNQTLIAGFGPGNIDYQDYNFTCGVASTKMALTWKGINVSEDNILAALGQNNTSMYQGGDGKLYWGNPNKSFLGYPNGSGAYGPGQSAYGVHWQPIINTLQNTYGISSKLYRNWNTAGLASEVAAGHPVLIFWWNGYGGGNSYLFGNQGIGGSRIDWFDAATGEQVEAIHGMHAVLVVGFNGDVNNPTSFIVLDPWEGYQTYSVDTLNYRWPKLQNTGVAIY